jgi:hypothetical protein
MRFRVHLGGLLGQVLDLFGDFVSSVFRHVSGDPIGDDFHRFEGRFLSTFDDFLRPQQKSEFGSHSRTIAHFSTFRGGALGYLFPSFFQSAFKVDFLAILTYFWDPIWDHFGTVGHQVGGLFAPCLFRYHLRWFPVPGGGAKWQWAA